jgi:hypothetical protein
MKRTTEKEMLLAIVCAAFYFGAYFLLVKPILSQTRLSNFPALPLFVYFLGVTASLLLFKRARWARVAIGAIVFSTALILSWLTVQWFALGLRGLRTPGSEFIVAGFRLSSWEFFMVPAVFALVALGFIFLGLWTLKRWTLKRRA